MRFVHHPLSSLIVAFAVWLGLWPISPLVANHTQVLNESLLILGTSAAVGVILALLRAPRALVLLTQLIAVIVALVWRGLDLAPVGEPLESLRQLTM
ncbi:MAG: hypothetical protein Q4F67_15810, partial [Propionibacteriaceae bacterium]|nr:hypothetical protein [Propionibacteriaceae bacterium]